MPTTSRPAVLVEKFYICVALFPKALSMLHSTPGLQFHCRIHPFTKDTLSLEVHNLKEIPALSFVKRSCFRAPCFPLLLFPQLLLSREINVGEKPGLQSLFFLVIGCWVLWKGYLISLSLSAQRAHYSARRERAVDLSECFTLGYQAVRTAALPCNGNHIQKPVLWWGTAEGEKSTCVGTGTHRVWYISVASEQFISFKKQGSVFSILSQINL